MADKKVSALTALTTPDQVDLVLVIDDPLGTPVSKKLTLKVLFANIPSNTSIEGTLTVASNTTINGSNNVVSANANFTGTRFRVEAPQAQLATKAVVSSNNAETQLGGGMEGSIFWDENHIYGPAANTNINGASLSNFAS